MQDAAHIKPLTSLRFFAAFWVVLYDYWPRLAGLAEPAIIGKGHLGVELFFTLSGFILCHVYLTSFADGRFRYGAFLWARLARVYPLHIATLCAMGLMAGAALAAGFAVNPNILSWRSLPANLFMVHAWGLAPVSGWNHPSWSISAEWFAYLTFPVFAWTALKLRERPYLAAAGALLFLAALNAAFGRIAGFPLTSATVAWGALRIVPCFALGCATYLVWRSGATDRRKQAALGAVIFGAGTALAAQFGAPDVLIVAGFAGLILSLAKLAAAGSRFGTQPIFVYLGEISYSVYMVCVPWQLLGFNAVSKILHRSDETLPWHLWILLTLAIIPLSALTYHVIEKPARRAMKLWAAHGPAHEIATVTAK